MKGIEMKKSVVEAAQSVATLQKDDLEIKSSKSEKIMEKGRYQKLFENMKHHSMR